MYRLTVGDAQQIASLLIALYERGLWLVEQLSGAAEPGDGELVRGVLAMRDVQRHVGVALGLDVAVAFAVVGRCAVADSAPPAIQGAALGFLWSLFWYTKKSSTSPLTSAASMRFLPRSPCF